MLQLDLGDVRHDACRAHYLKENRMTFYKLEEIEQRELLPGLLVRFVHSDNMTLAYWEIEAGSEMPLHSHPHEQIGMVYAGQAKMRIGNKRRIVEKGDFCIMPPNVEHEATCLGDESFVMLDIFYPAREDFIEKIKD